MNGNPKPHSSASANDKLVIFDTTLRDGEQSPGAVMTIRQKIAIAEHLDILTSMSSKLALQPARMATMTLSRRFPDK